MQGASAAAKGLRSSHRRKRLFGRSIQQRYAWWLLSCPENSEQSKITGGNGVTPFQVEINYLYWIVYLILSYRAGGSAPLIGASASSLAPFRFLDTCLEAVIQAMPFKPQLTMHRLAERPPASDVP